MLQPFNLLAWIEAHREELEPPVGNRCLFRDSEFIVMVVGGPNARTDYHDDPGDELFFQLRGDILLKTMQAGRPVDIPIREGEIFMLASHVLHSPRRPENTVGLVVERVRRADEREGFLWFCDRCHRELYAEYLNVTDIEADLPRVFDRYYGNPENRVCRHCGHIAPGR
jgi:3-hydroxyanthranilate 3,4-dioxygenase